MAKRIVCLVEDTLECMVGKTHTMEITIDLLTELERAELDLEWLKVGSVIVIVLLQIPKYIVYIFVIMPARVYGTLTYPWRKNVWWCELLFIRQPRALGPTLRKIEKKLYKHQ